ncbi:hypothetical protein [Spirosoma aerolatum]|uniref:hypothetical protein n=1 Tax=Spirosoma aerolatum TaxID=1211326 RepID=UPI0009AD4930|nr:hypothetical protein [Spirosoma aerolatum]
MPTPNHQGPAFAPISVQLRGSFFSPITPVSNFSAIVNAQKSHYLAAPGISYALPSTIIQRGRLGMANLSVITDLIHSNQLESKTTNFANVVADKWSILQQDLTQMLRNLQQDRNTAEFERTVRERASQSKDEYNQAVDDYVDQIITLGTKHPQIQNTTIVTVNDVFDVVSSAAQSVYQFFDDLLGQVREVIDSIVEWVSETINKIGETIGDAVSSVVSAIGDLF